MLKFELLHQGQFKVIKVTAKDLERYALHDVNDKPLVFKRVYSQALAIAEGKVHVYKKPSGIAYHRSVLRHVAKAHWLGTDIQELRLARDMYIKVDTIL